MRQCSNQNMRQALLLACLLTFAQGCSSTPKKPSEESWLIPFRRQWDREIPDKKYTVIRVNDLIRKKEDSLRFEVRPTDTRSEIFTNRLALSNTETWYAFSVYLPATFPEESVPVTLAEWENSNAMSWEENRLPILLFQYQNHEFSIRYRGEKVAHVQERFTGHWNDFRVQVKWSHGLDGYINVWLNDRQILKYVGKITNQDGQNAFFRFGIKREETNQTYVAYFSEVRQGSNESDVLLPGQTLH